ncbi:IpaD/SipD/SspD family type III secretion system needle tip protein [Citrobacter sp. HN-141]|uniref:IpaD/SipD/SspD family type III secretion system needle tip protein n=1 Tax=unclassified Citrobacter TaxID=2644389 RepID=UPI0029650570|nr:MULTISPECIES: IpaD/SipD/SspD family type III secretion system needle tip protein [unclassified Citrobacter]MDW2646198.1 IpaD/SipD/SspD family type III secretion system needle tip protein [Citrobacter sp. HN-141]MDW2655788.1 IpaD/SipD/SspD family type III secretion system needle tip protein [Citrobacter sp. HN-120]MDW2698773.1 IpaD/SipD/SspD family type III secretion system needle tip protein [Citrobacter sp. HN-144]
MSTSVTTAGQLSFSTLRTTTNAVSSSPEALPASTTADAEETGTRRQQVIDILAEKLSVYSEQYQQLLNKGLLIDTTPAQNMLKSSLSQLTNIGATSQDNSGETAEDSADVKLSWDITFDKNMDKDGDGKIDGDIDYSTFTWSNDNDHGDGSNFPESDWEIYANISTELRGLQTGYMDVYTDLANQSVEFLNDVNSFKSLMVTFISSDEDKMKIDIAGVNDALDAIIYGWGIYDADGNLNLAPINPETSAGPFPERGPVAIRGLDAQGVYYWADQLELSDQLTITTHIEAGTDGKMSVNTGDPADDIDNVTVVDSVANPNPDEPPKADCRLYLVAEADGTYTLYVYPDLQPIKDAKDATLALLGEVGSAGTTPAGETPTNAEVPSYDSHYYGNQPYMRSYDAKGAQDINNPSHLTNDYFVIPTTKDLKVVPDSELKDKGYTFPEGYTLVTSTDTKDYHEYDCFLVPTNKLTYRDGAYHVTEDIVLETETYNMGGNGPTNGGEAANIYVSDVADWDFNAHGVQASPPYEYRENVGSAYQEESIEPPYLNKGDRDLRYTGNDGKEKSYTVLAATEDMVIVPISELSAKEFYIPDGYTLITSTDTEDYHEYDCFLIPTDMLNPPKTNSEAGDSNASVHLTESVVVMDKAYDMNGKGGDQANIYVSPASTWDFEAHGADEIASISSSMFNEWENSMNTMSSTVESQSQVMSEKLSQANTIYNNLTKVLSSTIEALLETEKEFFK